MTRLFGLHRSTNLLVNGNHAAIRQLARHLEAGDYGLCRGMGTFSWRVRDRNVVQVRGLTRSYFGHRRPGFFRNKSEQVVHEQEGSTELAPIPPRIAKSCLQMSIRECSPSEIPAWGERSATWRVKNARSVSPSLLSERPHCASPPPLTTILSTFLPRSKISNLEREHWFSQANFFYTHLLRVSLVIEYEHLTQ